LILPDVNVLLYAFRADSADHTRHRQWVQDVIAGLSAYAMSPQVLASLIRISTHPKIYARPSRQSDAIAFADALVQQPHCQVLHPGPRHWSIFEDLCRHSGAQGNLVQDAWFAALAIEYGCEWVTCDRDYDRFQGLSSRPPF